MRHKGICLECGSWGEHKSGCSKIQPSAVSAGYEQMGVETVQPCPSNMPVKWGFITITLPESLVGKDVKYRILECS